MENQKVKILKKIKTKEDVKSFIKEFPQNVAGLITILFTKAWYSLAWDNCYFTNKIKDAVTLGNYIILNERYYNNIEKITEMRGLQKLSKKAGWLYLVDIFILKRGRR